MWVVGLIMLAYFFSYHHQQKARLIVKNNKACRKEAFSGLKKDLDSERMKNKALIDLMYRIKKGEKHVK